MVEGFKNRKEAGLLLAEMLKEYTNRSDVIVLALPRGGVPVGYEVAKALSLPLDVFIVRKIGVPGQDELAMGAISSGGGLFSNTILIEQLGIPQEKIDKVIEAEKKELQRRELTYRGNRPFPNLKNKTIILIDDGIATGASMFAALEAIKQSKPAQIIIAVPVAPASSLRELSSKVDKLICPLHPEHFIAVGLWYEDFRQTTDEEVIALLRN